MDLMLEEFEKALKPTLKARGLALLGAATTWPAFQWTVHYDLNSWSLKKYLTRRSSQGPYKSGRVEVCYSFEMCGWATQIILEVDNWRCNGIALSRSGLRPRWQVAVQTIKGLRQWMLIESKMPKEKVRRARMTIMFTCGKPGHLAKDGWRNNIRQVASDQARSSSGWESVATHTVGQQHANVSQQGSSAETKPVVRRNENSAPIIFELREKNDELEDHGIRVIHLIGGASTWSFRKRIRLEVQWAWTASWKLIGFKVCEPRSRESVMKKEELDEQFFDDDAITPSTTNFS